MLRLTGRGEPRSTTVTSTSPPGSRDNPGGEGEEGRCKEEGMGEEEEGEVRGEERGVEERRSRGGEGEEKKKGDMRSRENNYRTSFMTTIIELLQ